VTMAQQVSSDFLDCVDFKDPYFLAAVGIIIFNPLSWNIVARLEYKTHWLTKLCGGPYRGCYFLAFCIFGAGVIRDQVYAMALERQKIFAPLETPVTDAVSYLLFALGGLFVLSTYYRLGITGTYLGDYFGILMKEKVTGFPFTVMSNPMYNGSTLLFLSIAIWKRSAAGVVLSAVVFIVYRIAILFEEPFTNYIYSQRGKKST